MTEVSDTYLTPKQVAERVGVSRRTLWLWRIAQKGPAFIRRGERIYYSEAVIEHWYRNGDSISSDITKYRKTTQQGGLRLTG